MVGGVVWGGNFQLAERFMMSESPSKFLLFPRPPPPLPDLTSAERGNWSKFEQHRRLWMETTALPFWQGMPAVYAAILADNEGNESDGLTLTATIEDWPEGFEAQQHALVDLLDKSKLRQSWRSFAHWLSEQMSSITEGQMAVRTALLKEHANCARPMREIPLYSDHFRIACQQIICMPVRQWDAMFKDGAYYEPTSIDEAIVEKLTTRIARALNDPFPPKPQPCTSGSTLPQDGRRFSIVPERIVVWSSNPGALVGGTDSHGMNDRLFDHYLRPIEHDPDYIRTWRFDGFCGQLRVTGIDDEPWFVTVLAPDHFVGALVQLVRENEQ